VLTWVPSFEHRDHNSHVALRISHAPQLGSFPLALLRIISLALTGYNMGESLYRSVFPLLLKYNVQQADALATTHDKMRDKEGFDG
jgi:hypothetical protein